MKWRLFLLALASASALIANDRLERAYQFLYSTMDQYHAAFDVYANRDAGGNLYIPTIIGNYNALKLQDNYALPESPCNTMIRIDYPTVSVGKNDWAAVNWLYPDTNWGYWQAYNLSGATRLRLKAKGEKGGEKVEFLLGGTNRSPYNNPKLPKMDSVDLHSTGIVELTNVWQEFEIDLTSIDSFAIYRDGNSGANNRYIPSGLMNGDFNILLDSNCKNNPHSGGSCFRIEWNGMGGADTWKWNGLTWLFPEGNWCEKNGYDLTGATKIYFWARTEEPGLKLKFMFGNSCDSSGEIFISGEWQELTTEWKRYSISLPPNKLTNIRGGFSVIFDCEHDPGCDGTVFYLDDIVLDKVLAKDLSNVIMGFGCGVSNALNNKKVTFYIDDVQYELSEERKQSRLRAPHFLQSYQCCTYDAFDRQFPNTAYTYDNALALLAFLHRNTPEDQWRADVLAEAFIFCQKNDPDFRGKNRDNRIRNGYRAGELADPIYAWARLPFYYNEETGMHQENFDFGSSCGNVAWVMIALLHHYDATKSDSSLAAAVRFGEWLERRKKDDIIKGYSGGVEFLGGSGYSELLYKSTEHNLDIYVAFMKLYQITGESRWLQDALHAKAFIENMYNAEGHYFYIGTREDGITQNEAPLVEDVQTWAILAFEESDEYFPVLEWVKKNCVTTHCDYKGIDFDTDKDGVWFEGSAHAALAACKAQDSVFAKSLLKELRKAQDFDGCGVEGGIVAACHDGVSTGLDWTYNNRVHLGATCWYIFAESCANPYWDTTYVCAVDEPGHADPAGGLDFHLYQNYPNPFNGSTILEYFTLQEAAVKIEIYSILGKHIRTLFDGKTKGSHQLLWEGKDKYGKAIPAGVYVATMHCNGNTELIKLAFVK